MNKESQSSIPFDQYQRYGTVARTVECLRTDGQPLKILEVGANTHKVLGRLLPNDHIVYLDREVPEEMLGQQNVIVGDATNLTIPDASYDIVVALDVFEHIPPDSRDAFIEHTTRIARLMTVVAAPFDESGVQKAEREASDFWLKLFDYPHRWLSEHEERGLPKLGPTKSKLDALGLEYLVVSHGELRLWTDLMIVQLAKEYVSALRPLVAELDRHYQEALFESDFSHSEAYRQFLFIARGRDTLEVLRQSLAPQVSPQTKVDRGLVDALIASVPAIALEKASEVKRAAALELELQKSQAELQLSQLKLQRIQSTLSQVYSSSSWRLTSPFRSLRARFKPARQGGKSTPIKKATQKNGT